MGRAEIGIASSWEKLCWYLSHFAHYCYKVELQSHIGATPFEAKAVDIRGYAISYMSVC